MFFHFYMFSRITSILSNRSNIIHPAIHPHPDQLQAEPGHHDRPHDGRLSHLSDAWVDSICLGRHAGLLDREGIHEPL